MRQIPLQFSIDSSYHAADFLISACNEAAWAQLYQPLNEWPQPALLLRGASSSGKTHLAHIWATHAQAPIMRAADIRPDDAPQDYSIRHPALVIEDIHQIADERSLFHLLNFQRTQPTQLLLTVDDAACWDRFTLPDLRSRLQALPQVSIQPPDDELLQALMVKLFIDHQRQVDMAVIQYILPRVERSFQAITTLVARMEEEASIAKSPITVHLARRLLTEC